ncbi:MAG: hypothetical protein P8Z81_13810 [Deinococcales bacterium]
MNGAVDMTTRYLGLDLKHPLVPSASPLSQTLDGIRRLEDAGASAVVMYSLFEEQIEHESLSLEHYLSYGTESYAEALSFFPEPEEFNVGPDGYLELIRAAKGAVDIPIIGSLNGASPGGWTHYAKLIQEAGADALELNIYHIATDPSLTGEDVERKYLDVLRDVRELVSIPVAVKLSPYFSSMANFGQRLARAGGRIWCCRARTSCACRCVGSPSSTAASRRTSPSRPACTVTSTRSRGSWRGPASPCWPPSCCATACGA